MPRCPTLPAAATTTQPVLGHRAPAPTRFSTDPNHVMLAPAPGESGVFPIGVFSDVETALDHDEVEDVLHGFSATGAHLRGRHIPSRG